MRIFPHIQSNETAQSLVEYVIIIVIIAIAVLGTVKALGGKFGNTINTASDNINHAHSDYILEESEIKYSTPQTEEEKRMIKGQIAYRVSDLRVTCDGKSYHGEVSVIVPESGYTIRYGTEQNACTSPTPISFSEAGSHICYFTIDAGEDYYAVKDHMTVTIVNADDKKTIPLPTLDCYEFNYTGKPQAPVISFDADKINVSGKLGGVEAGEYEIIFKVKEPTQYTFNVDGSDVGTYRLIWKINKYKDPTFSFNKNNQEAKLENEGKDMIIFLTDYLEGYHGTLSFGISDVSNQFTLAGTKLVVDKSVMPGTYLVKVTVNDDNSSSKQYESNSCSGVLPVVIKAFPVSVEAEQTAACTYPDADISKCTPPVKEATKINGYTGEVEYSTNNT